MKPAAAVALLLLVCPPVGADVLTSTDDTPGESPPPGAAATVAERQPPDPETLTHGFWGLSTWLADYGTEVVVGSTNVYQTNVRGGLGTHQQSGRFTGSYDIEVATDFEKLVGLRGWGLLLHAWGGYPATPGINDTMVGSIFNVNWDAIGDRPLDLVEVILEWKPCEDLFALQFGKINFARHFDTSEYANDETSQFLNGAFINNLTIPIPDYCLGAVLAVRLTEGWSVRAGMGDAEANGRTTGFATTFDGDDFFFYDLETVFRSQWRSSHGPLPGNYRAGLWYDPQPRACSGGDNPCRNDAGVYASMDQVLLRENDDPEDSQGLGVFARYGHTDEKQNDLTDFWSFGFQYQGLVSGRNEDVLGVGFAQGLFSDVAGSPYTEDSESVLEVYYSLRITPWATVSPDIQYIINPGGDRAVADAIVVGMRAQVVF